MKTLIKLVVLCAFVAVIAVIGFALFQASQEPAAISNLRIEHEIKTMRQWFVIWTIVRFAFGLSLSIGLLALARFTWVRTRTVERLHYQDGLLPALEKDATPWYRKALGETWIAPLNLNHMGGAASLIRIRRDGTLDIANDNLGMAPEQQTHLVDGIHSVQRHAAGRRTGETTAEVKGRLGVYQPAASRQPVPALPAAAPAAPANPMLSLSQAIHHPDGAVLGQNHKTGELALWSPVENGHIAIWGGTRQGKSSRAAMTGVLWLIENDYHVLILDIDHGKTWAVVDGWAEFTPTDETLFPQQIKGVMREWKRRTDLLAQHAAYDISALPTESAPRRLVVVVEEYGALRTALLENSPDAQTYADKALSTLARRGAATGIYLMLLDQIPEHWPGPVKANCLTSLTFAQGFGKGNAVGYYHAHELRPGEFYMRGSTYQSYLAAPEAGKLLAHKPKRFLPRPGIQTETISVNAEETESQPAEQQQTINPEDWVGNNEIAAREYVHAHPNARVNQLARFLATYHGEPTTEFRRFQSEASKWWNLFHPDGKNYVPPELNAPADTLELDLSDPSVREALRNHPESWQVKA